MPASCPASLARAKTEVRQDDAWKLISATHESRVCITRLAEPPADRMWRLGGGLLGNGNYTNTISIGGTGSELNYASSATQTLSGVISGSGKLTKSGTGDLTLSVSNSYAGVTTISGGTLYAGATGALSTNNVTVGVSGRLVMTEDNAMGTNATLNLPDDTTETLIMNTRGCQIAALNLGAASQSNGVYRASENAWMGGSGRLYVGVAPPPTGMVLILR